MKTWEFTLTLGVEDEVMYKDAIAIADWYHDTLCRDEGPEHVVSVDGLEPRLEAS